MEWVVIAICALALGAYADRWLATRPRRPLSHMKPEPKTGSSIGMEELDITRANANIARKDNYSDPKRTSHDR
jgi:hypothetical protein